MKFLSRIFPCVEPGSVQERKVLKGAALLSVFVILLDVLSKILIVEFVKDRGVRYTVIPNFFDITYITNKGAAWGILYGRGALLLIISIAVFVLLAFFLRSICEGWSERYYALLLVMSGIIGNSLDRIFRGEVVDFLRFHLWNRYEWPSFNVADSAICIGVAIFVISMFVRPEKKNPPDQRTQKTKS